MDVSLRDMIYKTFSKMPVKQQKALKAEELAPAKSEPLKTETPKGVGDIGIAIQAQRMFNPGMPPAPPNATQNDQGTAPAMELSSKWDKGNE